MHGYWNVDDRKVSKSLGNMISPLAMRDRYGFEIFRWFLLREMSFGLDANFTEEALVERVNADLANNIGNLVSRTLNLVEKSCDGAIPEAGAADEVDRAVLDGAARRGEQVDAAMQGAPAASRVGGDRGVRVFGEPLRRRHARPGRARRIPRRRPRRAARCTSRVAALRRDRRRCSRPFIPHASQRIAREARGDADHTRRPALPARRDAHGHRLSTPMWIDSHTHVTAAEFDADRDAAMQRARDAGVVQMIAIGAGWGIDANEAAVAFAAREPGVFAAVGVHPHDAKLLDDAGRAKLRAWLDAPRVVAVGECGLDYHYMNSPRDVQRAVCAEQIALARERDLPVSIHVRGDDTAAWDELLDIWRAEGRGDVAGVLHCYTGSVDFA